MITIARSLLSALFVLGASPRAQATPQIDFEGRPSIVSVVGGSPWDSVTRFLDLDGDGRKDYLSGGDDFDRTYVVVQRDRGNGVFEVVYSDSSFAFPYPLPTAIACGDFNGDGVREIVYAEETGRLVFLAALASGQYVQVSTSPIPATYIALETGDLDGDGDVDFVGLRHDGTLRIHENVNGFFPSVLVVGPVSASVRALALGDMDGDGDVDAVVASETPAGEVSVLLNAGTGTFGTAITTASTSRPVAMSLADFDLDGALDVITMNAATATVRVLRNVGGGAFGATVESPVGFPYRRLDLGDADGDGDPDLVLSGASTGGVSYFAHVGSGAFGPPQVCASGAVPHAALTDLDADGDLDLAIVDRDALRNRGDGTFELDPFETLPVSLSLGIAAGDLDGDGDEDLLLHGLSTVAVRTNQGSGSFGPPTTILTVQSINGIQVEDVDGDGDLDVLVQTETVAGLRVLLNHGGTFAAPIAIGPNVARRTAAVGDVDGDGRLDIVVGTEIGVYVALSTGVATWAPFAPITAIGTGNFIGWGLGDLDGDGDPDLVTSAPHELRFHENLGALSFAPPVVIAPFGTLSYIQSPDVDGDGDVDLVCAATVGMRVVENQGGGTFVTTNLGPWTWGFTVDDLDHDGDPDVTGFFASYENLGGGTFTPAILAGPGYYARALTTVDVDDDDDEDLVILSSAATQRLFLLENRGKTGNAFCAGDGAGTACPCGNSSALGAGLGCANSTGRAGKLAASGSSSLRVDTLRLRGTGMTNSSALYFQGTASVANGAGSVFGDGLRCVAGTVIRLGVVTNSAGQSTFPAASQPPLRVLGQVTAPGTRMYQVWYRDAASFCTPSAWNLTNGLRIDWAL